MLTLALLWQLLTAPWPAAPPGTLSAEATAQLARSLDSARARTAHVWRDTPPLNRDGTVNVYIEIPRGESRKYEFDIARHTRIIDRVVPGHLGGFPVNYGFVPQTVSYDGDPFDALVLGPAIPGGHTVRGVVVGMMHMEDEKGIDSKVVLSPLVRNGKPTQTLSEADQQRIGDYFDRYKRHEPGKFSRVPGWDTPAQGLAYVHVAHRFFRECRRQPAKECRLAP